MPLPYLPKKGNYRLPCQPMHGTKMWPSFLDRPKNIPSKNIVKQKEYVKFHGIFLPPCFSLLSTRLSVGFLFPPSSNGLSLFHSTNKRSIQQQLTWPRCSHGCFLLLLPLFFLIWQSNFFQFNSQKLFPSLLHIASSRIFPRHFMIEFFSSAP